MVECLVLFKIGLLIPITKLYLLAFIVTYLAKILYNKEDSFTKGVSGTVRLHKDSSVISLFTRRRNAHSGEYLGQNWQRILMTFEYLMVS